jgi:hypothetical protein
LLFDLTNTGYVPEAGNKMKAIYFFLREKSEILNLKKFLSIPRLDGHQQVVNIFYRRGHRLADKIMKSIKKVKMTCTVYITLFVILPPRNSIPQPSLCLNHFTSGCLEPIWMFLEVRRKTNKRMKHWQLCLIKREWFFYRRRIF